MTLRTYAFLAQNFFEVVERGPGVLRLGVTETCHLKPPLIFKGHFGRKRYPFLGIFLKI